MISLSKTQAVSTYKIQIVTTLFIPLDFQAYSIICSFKVNKILSFSIHFHHGFPEKWHKLSQVSIDHHCLGNWPIFCSAHLIQQMAEVTYIFLFLISLFLNYFQLYLTQHPCLFPFDINKKVPIARIYSIFYTIDLQL